MAAMEFKFQEAADLPALARLAQRLSGTPVASWPLDPDRYQKLPGAPDHDTFPVRRRRILLCESGEVRVLHSFFEHEIYLGGQAHPIVWPCGPLSEGIVDRKYAGYFAATMGHSLAIRPLHMSVGGAVPFRKSLMRMGWKQSAPIAKYVLPLRPVKALREMAWFQRTASRRTVSRLLAWTGIGALAGYAFSGRKITRFRDPEYRVEPWDHFGAWADDLWREAMPTYGAVMRRDAATMNRLYRPGDARIQRMVVFRRARPVGWFLYTTQLKPASEMDLGFGGLRVGALVDTFGLVDHARPLLACAVAELAREGVHLIFGHWTHQGWCDALRDVGFLRRQTDQPISVSPAGADWFFTSARPLGVCHFTDGDCDGPYYMQAEVEMLGKQAA